MSFTKPAVSKRTFNLRQMLFFFCVILIRAISNHLIEDLNSLL